MSRKSTGTVRVTAGRWYAVAAALGLCVGTGDATADTPRPTARSAADETREMLLRCAQEDPGLVAVFDAAEVTGSSPFLRPKPGMRDWRTVCSKEWHEVYNAALGEVGNIIKLTIVETSEADKKVVQSWLRTNPCPAQTVPPALVPPIHCDTTYDSFGAHTRCN